MHGGREIQGFKQQRRDPKPQRLEQQVSSSGYRLEEYLELVLGVDSV